MSQLDIIITHTRSDAINKIYNPEEAKQQIKALMLELIGKETHRKDCPANGFTCVCPMWQQNKNGTITELRQKVNEL